MMEVRVNEPLAGYTSFGVGGVAERLIILNSAKEVPNLGVPIDWVVGYGTNSVISDEGLLGNVVMLRDGPTPTVEGGLFIVDAATSWDRAVQSSIDQGLWGIELMSGIPGNTGAALSGNIGAYGQTIADTFAWAKVYDKDVNEVLILDRAEVDLSYRYSSLQERRNLVILEVALSLSANASSDLVYASAKRVAEEMGIEPNTLQNRREVILETRKRAGSIYDENNPSCEKTAGSFFKASIVDEVTSRYLATFDESGKSTEELLAQNRLQGGDAFRASAALVLLAAGFSRGQSWGAVRLHPRHVLKIENTGEATAQDIYNVAQEILATVKEKLGITLEAEVQFIGDFHHPEGDTVLA